MNIKLLIFLLSLAPLSLLANTTSEIDHLMRFVASTPCQYERNGSLHSGAEALKHIEKKYGYFKDDIRTAEEFIEYSATKSMLSGTHYRVHCLHQPSITSRAWLMAELARYRQGALP